jgi:long-chain acyl-CoA synthetase
MTPFKNLPDILLQNCLTQPNEAVLYSRDTSGKYQPITYQQFYDDAFTLALGLQSFGVKKGDRVGLLSGNRPEWAICDFAVQFLEGIDISIYPTLSAQEIGYILADSQASVVIVETPQHFEAVRKILIDCPALRTVIAIFEGDMSPFHGVEMTRLDKVMRIGMGHKDESRAALQAKIDRISRDTVASIVYTSGTTGHPKGVMLTHDNFLSNVEALIETTPLSNKDILLSFLPLSHVFERTVGYYTVLAVGGKIYYAQNINTVSDDLKDARPTILVSVPRLYEKIQTKILDGLKGIKKPLFYWALGVGHRYKKKKHAKQPVSVWDALQFMVANLLVYRKIKARVGGRLRFFVSGGAQLSQEVGEFFDALDLTIIEGYGQTETSPVIACNRLESYTFGSVGKILPNVEYTSSEDGELLVRGPSITKGYYNMPEATAEIIDTEGWLHTGDIITVDADGFISIIDRKKELIVLSNGKKVPPQMVEQKLASSEFILQAMVIGENRNYLTALIVPDFARYKKATQSTLTIDPNSITIDDPNLQTFYRAIVEEKLSDLANFEHIKKISFLTKELTPEAGELTPTLKFKRRIICEKFSTIINAMYES